MVGAVQRWRKQNEGEANSLWREVAEANREVEESLTKLSKLATESRTRYEKVLEMCTHETASQVGLELEALFGVPTEESGPC